MTDWAIPQQAKLKYTQLFNLHDRSRSGFLSGLQCRDILMQSGLPRNVLAEIWNLSDIDGDGQLTREEFILAMHLTNQVRAGQVLPQVLPPDLVPPTYRRTRTISSTSINSVNSSVGSVGGMMPPASVAASSSINDDQLSQHSIGTTSSTSTTTGATAPGSILNSNSFEDKRRENFEKGRAELERRRLKVIEQQSNIISEQLVKCKKQVAEAKSKIDSMRSERDSKAGLITSLEAQLKTVRDRKLFLDHEEVQIIAIARDLNLVNSSNSADLDHQATAAKQESINQMKEKLLMLNKERDSTIKQLNEAQAKLEESKKELKTVSEETMKTYENYKEKIANAKELKQKFIEENKSKPMDFGSIWDASPGPANSQAGLFNKPIDPVQDAVPSNTDTNDPWAATTASTTMTTDDPFSNKQPFNDSFAFNNDQSTTPNKDSFRNNNDENFGATRDSSPFTSSASSRMGEKSGIIAAVSEVTPRKKIYRVLFQFEARNPDELTINPGDIITGSDVVCEPGWLSGELSGKSGLFPEAYVEPLPDKERTTSISGMGAAFDSAETNQQSTFELVVASQPEQPNTSTSNIVKYKVIYAFEARNPDELTINPGDIIAGVDAPHEPGWLMGKLAGQRGLFPEAYVERLAEAQQASEQMGTLRRGSSSGSLRSKKSRAKKAEVATVIANYRALGQEQLNLEKGQLVLIRRKMDSGWWEGELQIKDRLGSTNVHDDRRLPAPGGNELDHLIGELVDSELDYVNDLRLCQNAFIQPLSASFDVSRIFTNWSKLIEMHEDALKRLQARPSSGRSSKSRRYSVVMVAFQQLLSSIVELYVDFCSRQNDAARQLEAKIASDIRFKQLVSDSQRRLRKLIELNDNQNDDDPNIERAMRNTNLPLTTFLLKPMQRITKYGLLFDRMLSEVDKRPPDDRDPGQLRDHLQRLRDAAQALCKQVNEACRMKQDEQDNLKRLRWCQSHILQQSAANQADGLSRASYNGQATSPLSDDLRLTADLIRSQSFNSHESSLSFHSGSNLHQSPLSELIQFNSNTNCMGRRRLLKAGTLVKFRSGRELMAFLFNDFILLAQVKGGGSLRVENVFRSERAQHAYYKFYRPPIMLEDIQASNFDNELQQQQQQQAQSHSLACPTLGTPPASNNKEQEALVVSFLDRHASCIYNLITVNAKERADWDRVLSETVVEAKEARLMYQFQNSLKASRRISVSDCFGRLFVAVLELTRLSSTHPGSFSTVGLIEHSWQRRPSTNQQLEPQVQNLCIRLQLKLFKRTQSILDDDQKREIIPTSDEFKTKTILFSAASRQPALVDMNESMSNLELQRDVFRFDDNDCTQFLLASDNLNNPEHAEYLEMELIDDSRLREARQLGRKRIGLEQFLGRNSNNNNHDQLNATMNLMDDQPGEISSLSSQRTLTKPSGRGVQPLQPNRPVEMIFKLKSIAPDLRMQPNGSLTANYYARRQVKYNVKLRLHLQVFCDDNKLI